ncbi:hypothetical protein ESZ39_15575 [Colwellia sp. C1TZA3]|nr:hypothetical protein ESZ39_15575 [Colwellia sp. C1TZA3]
MLISIPIASYCSIERLTLNYFSCAQQDHKLNGTGITLLKRPSIALLILFCPSFFNLLAMTFTVLLSAK